MWLVLVAAVSVANGLTVTSSKNLHPSKLDLCLSCLLSCLDDSVQAVIKSGVSKKLAINPIVYVVRKNHWAFVFVINLRSSNFRIFPKQRGVYNKVLLLSFAERFVLTRDGEGSCVWNDGCDQH